MSNWVVKVNFVVGSRIIKYEKEDDFDDGVIFRDFAAYIPILPHLNSKSAL